MNTIKIILLVCCAALMVACGSNKNPELSGIYVSEGKSQYSVATDTLIIDAVSLATRTYQIQRHVAFQRIRDGKKMPTELKRETWQAVWNPDQQVLAETEYGRQIRLSADTPGVRMKNTLFRKIR